MLGREVCCEDDEGWCEMMGGDDGVPIHDNGDE